MCQLAKNHALLHQRFKQSIYPYPRRDSPTSQLHFLFGDRFQTIMCFNCQGLHKVVWLSKQSLDVHSIVCLECGILYLFQHFPYVDKWSTNRSSLGITQFNFMGVANTQRAKPNAALVNSMTQISLNSLEPRMKLRPSWTNLRRRWRKLPLLQKNVKLNFWVLAL